MNNPKMEINTRRELLSVDEYQLFQRLVYNHLGITLSEQKRSMLGHRLIKRVERLNYKSFSAYFRHINNIENAKELETALELITTNETFFFREEKHFDYLKHTIIPSLNRNKTFKVWSAACSTGEEPYSIAMLLKEHYQAPWNLSASDVNQSVVDHAIKGIYLDERMDGLSDTYRKTYCVKGIDEFEGYLRIERGLRNKIDFFSFNLIDNMQELGEFDLIFIRNVMIYFDDKVKQRIIDSISRILTPGGWLFISHSETLHGLNHSFKLVRPSIYQLKQ
jgi:chemotaxis protein methyltransferase CheR